jgi:hypothetical protein
MTRLLTTTILALAMAGAAQAQPAVLVKSKPIHGTVPDFFQSLPAKLQKWVKDEAERQFTAPTDLYTMEYNLLHDHEMDLQRLAKREHLAYDEVRVMLMHQVITKAATKMDRAVFEHRRALAKAKTPEAGDKGLEDLLLRKTMLLAEIEELKPRMTANANLLAKGSNELANQGARGK